ncbi:MAG TPA: hypothetical protein VGC99_24540 [Candidatus Tectomicrobia bacterium]|jgi:hypothetical protein
MVKSIRLSAHARENMGSRGATEQEVVEAIRTASWARAELGRLDCRKDFAYGQYWHDRFYITKQVRPIFVDEAHEIVVVTVYVYYF